MKKVLLIGSKGFVGSNFKKHLLENNYPTDLIFEIEGKEELDITNFDKLNNFLQKTKPEIIVNTAAFVGGIAYGYKYPAEIISKNSKMIINIYEASRVNGIEKLITPISNCAYPGHLNIYEESKFWDGKPHDSVFNYALTRRLIVAHGEAFYKQYKFNSINIVMSNMYGPNDHFDEERSHALGALIRKIYDAKVEKKKSVEIWGTGKPLREWLFVKDAAEAILRSFQLGSGHHFFNIGVNKGISISDLAVKIALALEWDGEFLLDETKPDGALEKKVDGSSAESLLDWQPETSLEVGIKETIEWYVKDRTKKLL